MAKEETGPQIIEAHQELVRHIEVSAGRIRALSIVTIAVAVLLSASYTLQLALPLEGTTSVVVSLADPGTVLAELLVLALVLAWLYVGVRDYRFSGRMIKEIRGARAREKDFEERAAASRPGS